MTNLTEHQRSLLLTALSHEIDRIEAREYSHQTTEQRERNANLKTQYIKLYQAVKHHEH